MSFIEHVEKFLGEINCGLKESNSGQHLSIAMFKDRPQNSVTTFLSLGLSRHIFELSEEKEVKFELVFSTYSTISTTLISSFLMSLCEAIINRHKAIFRGEVIPLSSELAKRVQFDGIYCSIPVYFDDNFYVFDQTSPPIVIVWAVPIYKIEMDFITEKSWSDFESILEEKDPDLYSLGRASVI